MKAKHMITVLLFAGVRDAIGKDRVTLAWPKADSIDELRAQFINQYPAVASLVKSAMFSRGTTYLNRETMINSGDEIAMIPAVSGG